MAEFTKIAWTGTPKPDGTVDPGGTFNPWIGCSRVSPGCENCYAENLMDHRYKKVKWGPGQPRNRTKTWNDPVKWNRQAEKAGVRKKVFCASLADFLDEEVPHQWREDLFALIESCKWIDWLMLTKRIENANVMLPTAWILNPLPHVWMGVTAENQKYWDIRVPQLIALPAAVRWVSYEPSLGPLDISSHVPIETDRDGSWRYKSKFGEISMIDWLIIGGESDQTTPAREFHIEWCEDAIAQCRAAGVVPFMKQVGSNAFYRGEPFKTKDKAGVDPSEWPESIRVREFPK